MKILFFFALLIITFSCVTKSKNEKINNQNNTDYLLQEQSISQLLAQKHQSISNVKGDFASFKKYLSTLNKDSVVSIAYAMDYIRTCLPQDMVHRDSVMFLFNVYFFEVSNKWSDSLETKYRAVLDPLYKDSTSAELTIFKNNLAFCGIGIFSSEGMFYLDVLPEYFYINFKGRVSAGVEEFLKIRMTEMKEGFSEDAGMVISFEQLHQRVEKWENYIDKFPSTLYQEEAEYYYTIYLETLLTGMDNSRIFDYESGLLLPEIKSMYEKIMKEKNKSASRDIISSYYSFLSRHQFKENDSIPLFLKSKNLNSMLSVQPHNR